MEHNVGGPNVVGSEEQNGVQFIYPLEAYSPLFRGRESPRKLPLKGKGMS